MCTVLTPGRDTKGRGGTPSRQRVLAKALVMAVLVPALSGCWDPARDLKTGTVGYVKGFAGGIVADEPRAVLVGRDVLTAGGSAVDAAVATGFALAVTLPSSAGIGGGGVCVVHDSDRKITEVLDFLPARGASSAAVPALPRGLFALHARYGRMRWEEILGPAEQLARFGEPISRALAVGLQENGARLVRDSAARKVFATASGEPVRAGHHLTQIDLAAFIGRLRRNPADLYGGVLGREFVAASRQAGSVLTLEQMRSWKPHWLIPDSIASGHDTVYTPLVTGPGGGIGDSWKTRSPASTAGVRGGGTGFVVVDPSGSAVACALTMHTPFGTGRMVPGFGSFLVPGVATTTPLAVALVINDHVNEFRSGIASSGAGAAGNAVSVLSAALGNAGDEALSAAVMALSSSASGPALVSALHCSRGLPPWPGSCRVSADSRGAGYGLLIGRNSD